MSSGSDGAAQLRVKRLDGICGVDNSPHAFGESEEWYHELPIAAPALRDCRILCAPRTLRKGVEGGLTSSSIGRAIDSPQRLHQALAILPGGKIHGMADQVDDAGLNDCLWENGINGLGKTLQAVDHGNENVLNPAALQLIYRRVARIWRPRSVRSRCQESPWCRPVEHPARCRSPYCARSLHRGP